MLDPSLRTSEARRLPCPHAEAVKTMKQVGPVPRPCAARNGVDSAALGHDSAQGAIGRNGTFDLGVAHPEQRTEQHAATHQQHLEESRWQVEGVMVGGHRRAPYLTAHTGV